MNKDLLFQLYAIHSPSNGEKKMRKFIKKYIRKNCGEVDVTQDMYGNLLCKKGDSETYPCLVSHIDQVQRNHSKDFQCVTGNDVVFGFSLKSREQQGLGADDKNGIYICLECLKRYDNIKVAFFVGEEVGCIGSSKADLQFFSDCRFIIEPDRRGSSDLITSMAVGDVCSQDFIAAISAGTKMYGYKEAHGSITDVGTLVERGVGISCLNLSCGYYEAHTDNEFTILSELDACLHLVTWIVEHCTDVYPYEYTYGGCSWGWYGKKQPKSRADYKKDWYDDWYGSDKSDYTLSEWDYDYQTMYDIIAQNPDVTFEDILMRDFMQFMSYDRDTLGEIYDFARDEYESSREVFSGAS